MIIVYVLELPFRKLYIVFVSSPSFIEFASDAGSPIENPELIFRPNGSAAEINHSLGNYGCSRHDIEPFVDMLIVPAAISTLAEQVQQFGGGEADWIAHFAMMFLGIHYDFLC
jgi:hypothetical protein